MFYEFVFNFLRIRLELGEDGSLVCVCEPEMMKGFDPNKLVQVFSNKGLPVVGGDNDSAVFCSNELADVDSSRRVHDTDKVSQPTYFSVIVSVCSVKIFVY